jgi:hypothetical protein
MFNTQFDARLSRGNGTGDRPTQILVKGDGNQNHPYYIQSACFAGETTRIKDILEFAQNNGVEVVALAYSGIPWVLESDGKWRRRSYTGAGLEVENSTTPIKI